MFKVGHMVGLMVEVLVGVSFGLELRLRLGDCALDDASSYVVSQRVI